MTPKRDSMTPFERYLDEVREELVNSVTGHMPASGECNEWLIRQSVRWGFDRVIRHLLGGADE
jgi:hypothetical protein